MSKKVADLIAKKKQQIQELANEISVLMERQVFESKGFIEKDEVVKIKTGRKKTDFIEYNIKAGFETWVEDFVDEDNGTVVSIDRSQRVSINGKRTNPFGKSIEKIEARLYEVYSEKPVWEQ